VPSGVSTYLLASGFLPGHPVVFSIDNTKIATLTASPLGAVSYNIEPTLLKLAGGRHTVTLGSMLITMTGSFSS
jgi:hypothetical protein